MILRLGTRVEGWDEADFASYSKPRGAFLKRLRRTRRAQRGGSDSMIERFAKICHSLSGSRVHQSSERRRRAARSNLRFAAYLQAG